MSSVLKQFFTLLLSFWFLMGIVGCAIPARLLSPDLRELARHEPWGKFPAFLIYAAVEKNSRCPK